MDDLADKKCIPCEGGIPSFNLEEIHKYLKKHKTKKIYFDDLIEQLEWSIFLPK